MPEDQNIQINPISNAMNRFRVIEHEDSQNGYQGFDIVFNNSGSVMRYDGGIPLVNRNSPVVIIQA